MDSEENLFFSEQIGLIDKVLAFCSDHIYIRDRYLRYIYANPAGLAALDLQKEQVLGKTGQELTFSAQIMEVYDAQCKKVRTYALTVKPKSA